MAAPTSAAAQQPGHQGLPSISSLTNGLPSSSSSHQRSPDQRSLNETSRDSGTWPQPQNSAAHNPGLQVHTLLNPDDSPHRASVPNTPQSARLPTSASSALPSINQGFHDANRDSQVSMESRRSSIDSRMHRGFDSMHLNNSNQPTSPYESTNNSQVSLAASLRRPTGGPMSPLSGRSSIRAPRQAPPIVGVGRMPGGPDPTAAKPTQGYAWAFPDEPIPEERRGSDSDSSTNGVSRQGSLAASSFRSSIFSENSQMPYGQKRFEDPEHGTTHHHSMQHRAVQSLQGDNMSSPGGVGNYSRTPELRVSHKLAERKRRSEMKDLFDDLNKAVPSNGGTKASKWEILTKAIDYIRNTQVNERNLANEVQRLQRDSEYAREAHKEIEMLKTEVQVMLQHLRRLEPNAPHVYGHFSSQLQPGGSHTNGTSSIALPPIGSSQSNYNSGPAPPAAMQGVEYGYGR